MKVETRLGKRCATIVIGLSIACFAGPARARRHTEARADSPVCSGAYGRALERVQEARLEEAQELFAVCARTACSEVMRRECAARRAQLDADIPSIVPLVTDNAGEPRVLVEVRVDGVLVTSRLDGRAVAIDPGKHELAFSNDDGVFATRHLMVVEGERNRPIHVLLHGTDEATLRRARALAPSPSETRAGASPTPAEAPPRDTDAAPPRKESEGAAATRPPVALEGGPDASTTPPTPRAAGHTGLAATLGALGLAGAGGFGLLTYWGRADNAMLGSCAPTCRDANVRHVRELYWAADASLGVGVVSLAVSTWLFARASGSAERATSDALSFEVRPTRAGGVAAVSGRF